MRKSSNHTSLPQSKKFKDLQLSQKEINVLGQVWKVVMNIFGVLLIGFFWILYYLILNSFIYDSCFIYFAVYRSYLLTITMMGIGIWLGFNIIFQFVLAVMISPGYTSDLFKKVDHSQTENDTAPFIYDPTKSQFNQTMIYTKLDSATLGYCNKCLLPKPLRTHHCSVCNKCVLKMDHHCPWINGCVGFQNHRHFALFLFYVFAATSFVTVLSLPIVLTDYFSDFIYLRTEWYQITWPLNAVLSVTMLIFCGWNWYLIIQGQTTIEYWGTKNKFNRVYKSNNTSFQNLKVVFGDIKKIYSIFAPSLRDLQSNGIIWQQEEDKNQTTEDGEQIAEFIKSQSSVNIDEKWDEIL